MIRFLFFMGSLVGYSALCARKRIASAIIPSVICAGIVIVINLCGLVNILDIAWRAILIGGNIFFLIFCIRIFKKYKGTINEWQGILTFLYVIGAAGLYFFFQTHGSILFDYDDFSHWGIVAKYLLKENHFPTSSSITSFTSYPLGTAGFIYYFCKALGNESTKMIQCAQAFLLYSFYFSIFSCIAGNNVELKNRKGIIYAVFSIFACGFITCFLMNCVVRLNALQVDNVLAAASVSLFFLCIDCRDYIKDASVEIGIIATAVVLIKNSGLFLALLAIAFSIYMAIENYNRERDLNQIAVLRHMEQKKETRFPIISCGPLLLPGCIFILWKYHCRIFEAGKHSMTLSSLLAGIKSGDADQRICVFNIIKPWMFSLRNNPAIILMAFIILACIIDLLYNKNKYGTADILAFIVILFVVYEYGMLLMYFFSMPYNEVVTNNGKDFVRYNGTLVMILAGLLFKLSLNISQHFNENVIAGRTEASFGIVFLTCTVICLTAKSNLREFWNENKVLSRYADFALLEKLNAEADFSENDKILVYYSTNYGVPSNGSKYYLFPCTDFTNVYSEKDFDDCFALNVYSYAIDLVNSTITHDNRTWTISDEDTD